MQTRMHVGKRFSTAVEERSEGSGSPKESLRAWCAQACELRSSRCMPEAPRTSRLVQAITSRGNPGHPTLSAVPAGEFASHRVTDLFRDRLIRKMLGEKMLGGTNLKIGALTY